MHSDDDSSSFHMEIPKYEKIALDIAYSIYHGDFKEGEKVKGRSTLSGKYNVSPETIRRAIKLLSDMDVVEVVDKIGISIKSKDKAHGFIQEYQAKSQLMNLSESIGDLFRKKQVMEQRIVEQLNSLVEHSVQLRNIGIIYPLELRIDGKSHIIGQTIGSTKFWYHTGATIIGIRRNDHLFLSPGPDMIFQENDNILYVGNVENISDKVNEFVNTPI
ncbi:MAG: hypothetical protein APF77_09950 [Clostridia bacterium BRH_c25]|nr:MAG: hypothetical protein APF77_09950 [Clostridia bacterium BRH_c25]